jgi:hypothetical protein
MRQRRDIRSGKAALTGRRSARSDADRAPFQDKRRNSPAVQPDWYEQDRDTADYAYGAYGQREPGHARSEPFPSQPQSSLRPGESGPDS